MWQSTAQFKEQSEEKFPVLIVGGGIVGLSAALFLSHHQVKCLLVERHSGTSIHPRARGINNRGMELYREIGLAEEIREAGATLAPAMGILSGQTLIEALADFNVDLSRKAFAGMMGKFGSGDISPTSAARVTQDKLEPVLLARARERGVDVRFYTELTSFEQDQNGVTALITDRASGTRSTIHADYMLAADGANSFIRQQLQAPTSGRGALGYLLNVLFKADLRELTKERQFSICRIDNPEVTGLFTSIDFLDTWVFHIVYQPEKGETPEQFSVERCKALLQVALGLPEAEITIKSILPWMSAMNIMDNFQHDRIFFAGDAAHQMPPWGGQGANTGIADVHNLAWKLATVLRGQADSSLLTTYNAERQPVGYLAADESAAAADEQGLMRIQGGPPGGFERLPRILGYYSYKEPSQAIIAEKDAEPSQHPLGLDGRPGTLVPHAWLKQQNQTISTLDLSVRHFALLIGTEGLSWRAAAQDIAQRLNIELAIYQPDDDSNFLDPDTQWQNQVGIEPCGALLIRPDGYIAWRSHGLPVDPAHELEYIFQQILGKALIS